MSSKIKILNWEKVNARKDVTNPSWFKFKHKFFEDPDFYTFSSDEKLCWIYILCEASRQNKNGNLTLNYQHMTTVGKLCNASMRSAIRKLKRLQIIENDTSRGRHADVTGAGVRQEERREEKKREEEIREEKKIWPIDADVLAAQAKLLKKRKDIEDDGNEISFSKAGS